MHGCMCPAASADVVKTQHQDLERLLRSFHTRFYTSRQVFETVETLDVERVAQFVAVTGDANILHRNPEIDGWESPGEKKVVPGFR